MSCFLGIKTQTALFTIVEVGDFKRFASAQQFASYLGLTPGKDSSGGDQNRLGITKAGNNHVRTLLVEVAQIYTHGRADHKSKLLKERQYGNPANIIAYADKAKVLPSGITPREKSQRSKNSGGQGTGMFHLGHDDGRYCINTATFCQCQWCRALPVAAGP